MARHTARSAIDPAAPWPRRAGWLPLAVLAIALGLTACSTSAAWLFEQIATLGADDY